MADRIEIKWVKYRKRGLEFTRKTAPPFGQWENLMAGMDMEIESSAFWRGDLYNQGSDWYGDNKASSVLDPETWSLKTWQNNASVCKRIERSRRRERLSYSIHAEVAYLSPDRQEFYLDLATEKNLGVRALRDETYSRGDRKKISDKGSPIDRMHGIRKKIEGLLTDLYDDAEKDWTTETDNLEKAFKFVQKAIESAEGQKESKK